MSKYVLIPDSFKGTMDSIEVCDIMARAILAREPDAVVDRIPVADGGEGTVDCFLAAMGGEKEHLTVQGPLGRPVRAFYGLLADGATAVVELAACAGLPLVGDEKDPCRATTYGVGQLMLDAVARGRTRLVVGLGGSATNDLGAGMAAAAGAVFTDADGKAFVPTGESLGRIAGIDLAPLQKAFVGVEITTMCDIDNPLCGPTGAAHVFAPQKGADPETVDFLDGQLHAAAQTVRTRLGADVAQLPGAGAAGGAGAGMVAFFGSRLCMGIEAVLDAVDFDGRIGDADWVLSGEGRLDSQSLRGKVVIGVARRTKPAGLPLLAVVGDIGDGIEGAYGEGVTAVFSINRVAVPYAQAKLRAREDLALTMDSLMRFMDAVKRREIT